MNLRETLLRDVTISVGTAREPKLVLLALETEQFGRFIIAFSVDEAEQVSQLIAQAVAAIPDYDRGGKH